VLSFTAEEAWQELRKTALGRNLAQSIFLSDMPRNSSFVPPVALEEKWNEIRRVRELVQKALEEARAQKIIGAPLEAKVIFKTNDQTTKAFLESTLPLWPEIAIVSAAEVTAGNEKLAVEVTHADGHKCARCWQWKPEVGTDDAHDLCNRCAQVLAQEEFTQKEGEKVSA